MSRELAWRANRFCLLSYQTPLALEWPFYTVAMASLFLACRFDMLAAGEKVDVDVPPEEFPFDEGKPRVAVAGGSEPATVWCERWPVSAVDVRGECRIIFMILIYIKN